MKRITIILFAMTMKCVFTCMAHTSTAKSQTGDAHTDKVSEALEKYASEAEDDGISLKRITVMQHGRPVADWQAPGLTGSSLMNQNEMSGMVTAIAIGMMVDEKRLSLADPVIRFFPDKIPNDVSDNLQAMTVRHLLTMTTGHDVATPCGEGSDWVRGFLSQPVLHAPGTYFCYDRVAGYMLSAIVQTVTGQTLEDYLQPRLFEPLDISRIEWEKSPQGICLGGWGLRISSHDMARIGSLLVQKGQWNGQKIIPRRWVRQMTSYQTGSCPSYVRYDQLDQSGLNLSENDWIQGFGYQIWMCRGVDFRTEGSEGQLLFMVPEFKAVVAINTESADLKNELDLIFLHILPSIPEWSGKKEKRFHSQTGHHRLHYTNSPF